MNRPPTPMERALALAREAGERGEVPVGAVVVAPDGAVLAAATNAVEAEGDAARHAEIIALAAATRTRGDRRLAGCDLYVTLEPCPMCAGAIGLYRLRRLVFGAYDPKGGGVEHGPRVLQTAGALSAPEIVGGVCERESAALLRAFFAARR